MSHQNGDFKIPSKEEIESIARKLTNEGYSVDHIVSAIRDSLLLAYGVYIYSKCVGAQALEQHAKEGRKREKLKVEKRLLKLEDMIEIRKALIDKWEKEKAVLLKQLESLSEIARVFCSEKVT